MIQIRKTIYCETDFLRVLFERLNKMYSPWDEEGWNACEYAKKIILGVFCQNNVIIHCDDEKKFHQLMLDDENFRGIVRRAESTKGYGEIDCSAYVSIDSSPAPLNAIYFIASDTNITDTKGIMVLTPNSINNTFLYQDFGDSIENHKPASWYELLKKARHSCNALLAVDNFLYKGRENNLYPILDSLLPQHLPEGTAFQISLFMQEQLGLSIKQTRELIQQELKKIRPNLLIDLTIYKCYTSDFHDRAIITNNLWIGCEGGFDLLKKDKYGFRTISTKLTKTHLRYPFLHKDWATKSYEDLLRDAEKICNSQREYDGPNINRLFDQ